VSGGAVNEHRTTPAQSPALARLPRSSSQWNSVWHVEPRSYRIQPQASRYASLEVNDDRTSLSSDDDLIEIALRFSDVNSRMAVALSVGEVQRLRDVLDEVICRGE
jgi:hypothetical protein